MSSLASRRNIPIVIKKKKTRLIYFNMTCMSADPFCVSRLSKVYATSMKLLCNCIVIPIQQYTKVREKYACTVRHVRHIVFKQGHPLLPSAVNKDFETIHLRRKIAFPANSVSFDNLFRLRLTNTNAIFHFDYFILLKID